MRPAEHAGGAHARRWQLACAVCAAALIAVSLGYAWPMQREAARQREASRVAQDGQREAQAALDRARESLASAQAQLTRAGELAREREAASGEVRGRIEKLERVLSTQFGRLARADMLLVSSAGDRLSVAVATPALFPLGRTQVTANGRALLCELAQTILAVYDGQLRVSGYYGKPAITEANLARHGSPWQLSAARAASAAAVLERDCEVPAERVYAVAYGPRAPGPLGENVALELVLSQRD